MGPWKNGGSPWHESWEIPACFWLFGELNWLWKSYLIRFFPPWSKVSQRCRIYPRRNLLEKPVISSEPVGANGKPLQANMRLVGFHACDGASAKGDFCGALSVLIGHLHMKTHSALQHSSTPRDGAIFPCLRCTGGILRIVLLVPCTPQMKNTCKMYSFPAVSIHLC